MQDPIGEGLTVGELVKTLEGQVVHDSRDRDRDERGQPKDPEQRGRAEQAEGEHARGDCDQDVRLHREVRKRVDDASGARLEARVVVVPRENELNDESEGDDGTYIVGLEIAAVVILTTVQAMAVTR